MKKMIAVCFVFMFLLAISVGCPQTSVEQKPAADTPSPSVVEFSGESDDSNSMFSSDETSAE